MRSPIMRAEMVVARRSVTAVRAVRPAIALLALGKTAHATCNADGTITGTNSATITLGSPGCATASGMSATVVSGATVTPASGVGVTTVPGPG